MSIIDKLASSLGRRDEIPNQELARSLAQKKDLKGIKEIINHLHDKNKSIQSDCIKVIDELSEIDPDLVSPYIKDLVTLLDHKNNRLQWGAMAALDNITTKNAKLIYSHLAKIISAADKGSVITKDRCVSILIKLCIVKHYSNDAYDLLFEQLQKSPTNQLPMYAENTAGIIDNLHKKQFTKILTARLPDIEKESKRKRVEKVIRKFS
jgi:hypothetical protein